MSEQVMQRSKVLAVERASARGAFGLGAAVGLGAIGRQALGRQALGDLPRSRALVLAPPQQAPSHVNARSEMLGEVLGVTFVLACFLTAALLI